MSKKNTESREVKTESPETPGRVRAGEPSAVTDCGGPVADLSPGRAASRQKTAVTIDAIRRTRKTVSSISDERLEEYRKEGRK